MTATPIRENFPRRITGLSARLAMLEVAAEANYLDAKQLRADIKAAIETPFGTLGYHEPDDPIIYAHDEDGDLR